MVAILSEANLLQIKNFQIDAFLRDYWQKAPLLIPNPWTAWSNPLEPDELAGLACEEGVEARLVTQTGGGYAVEHGPFAESRFADAGRDPWTLMVQAVDHQVPPVAALLDAFRFIPNWRIDDVMVSYAVDGGGVGPHYDQYDVFLIQGLGSRRWQVGARCDERTALQPNADLRLLAQFEPTAEWVLEPGDILYVPPGVAHNGVAVGDDCMTYSIGFRAPSRGDLIERWAEHLADQSTDDDRYADPALPLQDNPGEITAQALADLHAMVIEKMADPRAFAHWFGRYNTAPKNPEIDWAPEVPFEADDLFALGASTVTLNRNPASRFSFVREGGGAIVLFVDGQSYACADECASFAERLCGADRVDLEAADMAVPETLVLVLALLNLGSIKIDEGD